MYEGLSAEAMGYGDLPHVGGAEPGAGREAARPGPSLVVYGVVAVLVLVGVAYALFW